MSSAVDPDHHLAQAIGHFYRGHLAAADAHCRRSLAAAPDRAGALNLLGAIAALAGLRAAGLRLFLVTDGRGDTQRHKVQALGLGSWFEQMVFTGDLPEHQRKPSPYPFQLACRRLGVEPALCAYVGDNPDCDFAGPLGLGMATIAVGTGPFAGRQAPPGQVPHVQIDELRELAGLVGLGRAAGGPA